MTTALRRVVSECIMGLPFKPVLPKIDCVESGSPNSLWKIKDY